MKPTFAIALMLALSLTPRFSAADEVIPCEPVILDQLAGGARAVQVQGDIAVVANGYGGLLIFDVSNPRDLVELGRFDFHGDAFDVAISGDAVYVPVWRWEYFGDPTSVLEVVDISDPASPQHHASLEWGWWVRTVTVDDKRLYITEQGGVRILDITDPLHPVTLGTLPGVGFQGRIALTGAALYVVGDYFLSVYDVSDPEAPFWTSTYYFFEDGRDIVIGEGAAYLAHAYSLTVFDITNPFHPVEVEVLNEYGTRLWTGGDTLCVTRVRKGKLFDLTDPLHPTLRSKFNSAGRGGGMAAVSNVLLIPQPEYGLEALDLAEPVFSPVPITAAPTMWSVGKFHSHQGTTYVTGSGHLAALDVSDPTNIQFVGTPSSETFGSVAFAGDYAFAGSGQSVTVLDLHDPESPRKLKKFPMETYIRGLLIDDGLAYCAGYTDGMTVLDVSNPEAVVALAAEVPMPGTPRHLVKRDDLLYLAAGGAGGGRCAESCRARGD